jgi:hypothetical protein
MSLFQQLPLELQREVLCFVPDNVLLKVYPINLYETNDFKSCKDEDFKIQSKVLNEDDYFWTIKVQSLGFDNMSKRSYYQMMKDLAYGLDNTLLLKYGFYERYVFHNGLTNLVIKKISEDGNLLKKHCNLADAAGRSLLSAFASSTENYLEYEETMKKIISYGANVNKVDSTGMTSLMYAIRNGTDESVKILLDNGANVNIKNNNGSTALLFAFICNKNLAASMILDRVDIDVDVNIPNDKGETALMLAAKKATDNSLLVKKLLVRGADVNAQDDKGMTALMHALNSGYDYLSLITCFLTPDANLQLTDKQGRNVLYYADTLDNLKVKKVLEKFMTDGTIEN